MQLNIEGNKVILYNPVPFRVNIPEFQTFKVVTKTNPVQSCTIPGQYTRVSNL